MSPPRVSERKEDQRRRALLHLSVAERAAKRGDVVAEETAIQEGFRVAADATGYWSWSAWLVREYEQELSLLTETGRVRRGAYLGTVGDFDFYADRIVTGDGSVLAMHPDARASVEASGSLNVTQSPTLTRMAAGSVLPGSALIPGFAFQKKKVHDSRKLYFTLEHPKGAALIELKPRFETSARQIALDVNQAARSCAEADVRRRGKASTPPLGESGSAEAGAGERDLATLERLATLRDSGVLTPEEFESAKRKILERL